MSYLESVRDRLREEHEERVETLNAKTMRVVEFQLQLQSSKYTAREVLQQVDPSAPIPEALEGGDGKGPLYLCVLREEKVDALQAFCESNYKDVKIYSGHFEFSLSKILYRPDYFVHWNMGISPTVRSR